MTEEAPQRTAKAQGGVIDQLERLRALLENGTVTAAEFDAQKSRILNDIASPTSCAADAEVATATAGSPVEIERQSLMSRIVVAWVASVSSLLLLGIPFFGWILCPVVILFSIAHVFGLQAEQLVGVCPSCSNKITLNVASANFDKQTDQMQAQTCSSCKKSILFDANRRLLLIAA